MHFNCLSKSSLKQSALKKSAVYTVHELTSFISYGKVIYSYLKIVMTFWPILKKKKKRYKIWQISHTFPVNSGEICSLEV